MLYLLSHLTHFCFTLRNLERPESKLVEEIVGDILNKLNAASPSSNFRGRIQTNSSIDQQMDSTVSIGRGRSIRRRGGTLSPVKLLKKEKNVNVSIISSFCWIINLIQFEKIQAHFIEISCGR